MEVKIYDVSPNSKENTAIAGNKLLQATTELSYLTPINYATFENGGINFYEDTKLYDNGDYIGYCSSTVSNENGVINLSLTITPKSGYTLQTDKISISFFETYCTYFDITVTYTSDLIVPFHITENNNLIVTQDIYNSPISNIVFTFHTTQYPYSFVKISSIDMGTTTVINKFTSFDLLEECNVISSDCSINKLEFSGVTDNDIGRNATVILTHNGKFYGKFYTDEVEQIQNGLYNFSNQDLLSKADKVIYDRWDDAFVTVTTMLNEISEILGIPIINNVGTQYILWGFIKAASCRYALTQVAWAIGGIIDDSRDDRIIINPIPTEISSVIKTSDKRIIGDAKFTKSKKITKAIINEKHIPLFNVATENVFQAKGDFTSPTKIYFTDYPIKILSSPTSGTTIIDKSFNFVEFTSTSENVSFTGYKYNYYDIPVTITNPTNTDYDEENILDFSDFTIYAISSDESSVYAGTSKFKYEQVQKYIQSKGTIKAKIVVENEKVGDLIKLETAFSGIYTGIITSMNIVSLGYQNIADIEVLEWQAG